MTKHFSEIFDLGLSQPQLDFVDIIPSRDTQLYIDPFAISLKEDEWSIDCNNLIAHFFETAIDLISSGQDNEAKRILNGLSEPNETCLGESKDLPAGRGVTGKKAIDLYDSLSESQAAKSGVLSELAECDLFIEGIARDGLSDITTNIIRQKLVEYTIAQCSTLGIDLDAEYPTGRYWDRDNRTWTSTYAKLPIVDGKVIILVPKFSVRRAPSLKSQEFYSHHVVNFIQEEEFKRGSLYRTLKHGERRPAHKKVIKKDFPSRRIFWRALRRRTRKSLHATKSFIDRSKVPEERSSLRNSKKTSTSQSSATF